jgi:hypothetical protein
MPSPHPGDLHIPVIHNGRKGSKTGDKKDKKGKKITVVLLL